MGGDVDVAEHDPLDAARGEPLQRNDERILITPQEAHTATGVSPSARACSAIRSGGTACERERSPLSSNMVSA
jgi:hypothetical protein